VLSSQLDWLSVEVAVLTAPSQTLMVTVTAPTPGEATFVALPATVEHEGEPGAEGDGGAVGVGDVSGGEVGSLGSAVGSELWVGDALVVGRPVGVFDGQGRGR
jgi:hypothetical protein